MQRKALARKARAGNIHRQFLHEVCRAFGVVAFRLQVLQVQEGADHEEHVVGIDEERGGRYREDRGLAFQSVLEVILAHEQAALRVFAELGVTTIRVGVQSASPPLRTPTDVWRCAPRGVDTIHQLVPVFMAYCLLSPSSRQCFDTVVSTSF